MEIKDKVVVVTGGAHGIGEALAERFHREGASFSFSPHARVAEYILRKAESHDRWIHAMVKLRRAQRGEP